MSTHINDLHPDPVIEWSFCALTKYSKEISDSWQTVMRINPEDVNDVLLFIFPHEKQLGDDEDLSFVEYHPHRITATIKDGIILAKSTESPISQWMLIKLKQQPELAGRIIGYEGG